MTVFIREETWAKAGDECRPLMLMHQAERHVDVGVQPEPDFALFQRIEEARALLLLTARVSGKVRGYIIWTLSDSDAEYAGASIAQQGPWFVHPDWRATGAGLALFRQSIRHLRELKVALAAPHHWEEPRLGQMFERLGAKRTITSYLMNLQERSP